MNVMPDHLREAIESTVLDQKWMEAESWADIFLAIAAKNLSLDDPDVQNIVRKACAIVGLECKRRERERENS